MRMDKSKSVFQGAKKGIKMVGFGFYEGITGMLM